MGDAVAFGQPIGFGASYVVLEQVPACNSMYAACNPMHAACNPMHATSNPEDPACNPKYAACKPKCNACAPAYADSLRVRSLQRTVPVLHP